MSVDSMVVEKDVQWVDGKVVKMVALLVGNWVDEMVYLMVAVTVCSMVVW